MFEQKAFVVRDVGQAGMLIILGLGATVIAYVGALALCGFFRFFMHRIRPLAVVTFQFPSSKVLGDVIGACVISFLAWPAIYSVHRTVSIFLRGTDIRLMDGAVRSVLLTVVLAGAIACCSTLLSFLLSAFFQEQRHRSRWWLPALYFLALVPEAAYVLFSLCVTGSGILKASPWWLFFLMTSFSAPISFFLWESLWGEAEQRKLWMLSSAMRGHLWRTFGLALREWRLFFGLTFIVNFWMTVDNVFITNFSAGPKWKPISAVLFSATKRGFQDEKFLTGTLGSLTILALIIVVVFITRQRSVTRDQ
jgi:ABC-type spermidine/putrescine transport system permease subunit II